MEFYATVTLKKIDKPVEIPAPRGIVYGCFEITTNIERENIESATVNFRVSKSWCDTNDISVTTIKMCRYANGKGWDELETEKTKEDDDYFYFSAETPGPGLSLFVITGEKIAPPTPAPALTPTPSPPPTATPSPPPTAPPAQVPVIKWFIIIAAIVVSAVIVLIFFYWFRRR